MKIHQVNREYFAQQIVEQKRLVKGSIHGYFMKNL